MTAASEFLMKYLRMIYANELTGLSRSEHTAVAPEWLAFEPLPSVSQLVGEARASAGAVMGGQARKSRMSVTDGPFTETKG